MKMKFAFDLRPLRNNQLQIGRLVLLIPAFEQMADDEWSKAQY
jgi:hypothetical protein